MKSWLESSIMKMCGYDKVMKLGLLAYSRCDDLITNTDKDKIR